MTELSNKQLGVIAREAIAAKNSGESKYTKLVIDMSLRNNMPTNEVEELISYMADNY